MEGLGATLLFLAEVAAFGVAFVAFMLIGLVAAAFIPIHAGVVFVAAFVVALGAVWVAHVAFIE